MTFASISRGIRLSIPFSIGSRLNGQMRYLRMLSNSVFAGLLASVYLTLLLLHLNPSVPLDAHAVWPLFTVLMVSYGVHIAVVSYALYVLRQIAIVEPS